MSILDHYDTVLTARCDVASMRETTSIYGDIMRSKMLTALGLAALAAVPALGQDPAGTVSNLTALDYAQIEML